MKETCQMNMCTKSQVEILKDVPVLVFEGRKRSFFTLLPAISALSQFLKFVRFGPFKKFLGPLFAFLTENEPKTCIMPHKAKIFGLTFP